MSWSSLTSSVARPLIGSVLVGTGLGGAALLCAPAPGFALDFRIDEGNNINSFVREHAVAAHLLLGSGTRPRVLIAFPAGDSAVAVWFASPGSAVHWRLLGSPRATTAVDPAGRRLNGIEAEALADVPVLRMDRAVLSSVRVVRTYQSQGTVPEEVLVSPTRTHDALTWARNRLDGAPGYRISIQALEGARVAGAVIRQRSGASLHLRIRAFTGEQPLTPFDSEALFTPQAADDSRAREVLAFLSYRQKFLAGSWRFDTYFGRDTLMSLALLGPALQPEAVASGLSSVLERLSSEGEVAHEEDIGEFAVLRNSNQGRGLTDRPIYDYGMVDEDFMLAPLARQWLVQSNTRPEAQSYLARRAAAGTRAGDALVRNFLWVVRRTRGFATAARAANLIGLKAGRMSGQWRDSDQGLGGGRYPYDVNVVFVPAALQAISELLRSGLLDPYLSGDARRELQRAGPQLQVWSRQVAPLFSVTVPADRARSAVSAYAQDIRIDPHAALDSLGTEPLVFDALSLDAEGTPIPVMHSDDGFALLFGMPTAAELERSIESLMRPFPAGLWTPIGLLIANPAFAGRALQEQFSSSAYHGTVVWSWQQAVLAAGLDRQLTRTDLSPRLHDGLLRARQALWSAIRGGGALRTSELWSWSFANGCYRAEPFGQRGADADESNAAQLWSTVFLALRPPADAVLPDAQIEHCRKGTR